MTAAGARPWLILVTDRRRLCVAAGRPLADGTSLLEEQAAAAAATGVTAVQLREYDLEAGPLLALAERLVTRLPAGRLLVNDRADVAAAIGAGVHLRTTSLPAARLRAWLPADTVITRAVHGAAEAAAAGPVQAVVAGTVRATVSKPAYHTTLGLDGLRAVVRASAVPVVAIGGVTAADWPALREAGAAGVAAIGWFLPAGRESVADAVARATREWACGVSADGRC